MSTLTNFPAAGDDRAVSLRNSLHPRFDSAYAANLRQRCPEIWALSSKVKGDAHYEILSRVARQGGVPKTKAEEKAVRLREAWAARHSKDHRLPGVVAQVKWLVVGERGEAAMKADIEAEKEKSNGKAVGAGAPPGAGGSGEARDAAHRSGGRTGDEGESPLYLQQAVVRAVRRETRPDRATGQSRSVVVVEFVASTEAKDSHESIVKSNWQLTRYTANPVLLWMHGRMNDLPALGTVEGLHKEATSHVGVAVFDDTTQFDRDVAAKYEKGVLKGFSIGFYPHTVRFERIEGEDVLILDDIEILEISCVNVPSNPEALAKSVGGWDRDIAKMSASLKAYEALHARALVARMVATDALSRGAVPYAAYPLKEEGSWDAAAAEKRMKERATKGGEVDWAEYGKGFAWVDPDKRETAGGYKLPHHDVQDGKLVTVKAGVIAAGNAVQGSRGGVSVPEGDLPAVKSHLAKHYVQFGLTPPWEKAAQNHGEASMNVHEINVHERDIRATKKGVTCEAKCPNCKEGMVVHMEHAPLPEEKAAEFSSLQARAGTAEKRVAELDLELKAAGTRAGEFERQLNETRALVIRANVDAAEEALKARSGEKIWPAEIPVELEIARGYLSDLTPSADPAFAGKSVGQEKWSKRLAVLDARPSLRLLAPPATTGASADKPREQDPKVTDAVEGRSPTPSVKAADDVLAHLRSLST